MDYEKKYNNLLKYLKENLEYCYPGCFDEDVEITDEDIIESVTAALDYGSRAGAMASRASYEVLSRYFAK